MKIHLANYESGRMGGGWTFQDNFAKGLGEVSNYKESDVYFIAGASMVSREEVTEARAAGKKIVLRVDNIPRNSRNRGTAMSRMKDFADWADLVVYQSEFAKGLLDDFLQPKNSVIILNGCDQDIFRPYQQIRTGWNYLFARSSSDETKNWEMARSCFQSMPSPKRLIILGKPLDPKLHEYNFDFFMGEQAEYIGEIHDRRMMAKIYNSSDFLLYSFFNDACSNTLIEALCCDLRIVDCYGMLNTGGAPEIMEAFRKLGSDYFSLERMTKEYLEAINVL